MVITCFDGTKIHNFSISHKIISVKYSIPHKNSFWKYTISHRIQLPLFYKSSWPLLHPCYPLACFLIFYESFFQNRLFFLFLHR